MSPADNQVYMAGRKLACLRILTGDKARRQSAKAPGDCPNIKVRVFDSALRLRKRSAGRLRDWVALIGIFKQQKHNPHQRQ